MPRPPTILSFDGQGTGGAIIGFALAGQCCLFVLIRLLMKRWPSIQTKTTRNNAHVAAGEESVYGFLLSDSFSGWIIALCVGILQVLAYGLFIDAASLANENSDYVYSWRCPRNGDECSNDNSIGAYGWVIWALLLTTTLLDDIANSVTLIFLSATRGSLHCFVTAFVILSITTLSVCTSFVYNRAIATTNTELIVNALVLLILNTLDESFARVVIVLNPNFVERMSEEAEKRSRRLLKYTEPILREENPKNVSPSEAKLMITNGETHIANGDVKEGEGEKHADSPAVTTETAELRMAKLEQEIRRLEKLIEKMEVKKDD